MRHRFDKVYATPDYLIVGGLVFVRGSVPFYSQYIKARRTNTIEYIPNSVLDPFINEWKLDADHEIVVLIRHAHTHVRVPTCARACVC